MKIKNRVISVILIISALLICFLNITAYASDSEDEELLCSEHYFSTIDGHIPKNVRGTCVYVALSMLLSFYDSYWNDDFVWESFEAGNEAKFDPYTENPQMVPYLKYIDYPPKDETSTGESTEELTEEELRAAYKSFAMNNANEELHLYLVSLAANNVFKDNGDPLITYDDESYGINIYEAKKLLEYYLYDVIGFTRAQIEVCMVTSTGKITADSEIFQIIKEKVSNGIPVYYRADPTIDAQSTSTTKTEGHAMIAYRYLPNENKIKLHLGSKDRYDKNLPGVEYDTDAGIIWLDIKDSLPHKCANHYTWWPTKELVCSCVAYGDRHPAHVHEYSLESTTETTHTYTCAWGCEKTEHHDRKNCYSISNVMHTATCSCGRTYSEQHNFERKSARYSVCMNCGYTRDHFGGNENVHLGTKEDEETE